MNGNYLYWVLEKYKPRDLIGYSYYLNTLRQQLISLAGDCYLDLLDSGSRAKGTAIALASDVDILVSLKNECNENTGGLKSIFEAFYNMLNTNYSNVRKQNVSIRIDISGLQVDVTPARKQLGVTTDHSLWLSKQNTWQKTNVNKHILDVSNSGRTNEIKLTKIWRELNNLDFPSIYLEYLVIDTILSGKPKQVTALDSNFYSIIQSLATGIGNPLGNRVVDPANSNNVLSDLLTDAEKRRVHDAAVRSLSPPISWSKIVW